MDRTSEIVIREKTCWTKKDVVGFQKFSELVDSFNSRLQERSVVNCAPSFNDYRLGILFIDKSDRHGRRDISDTRSAVTIYVLSNYQLKDVQTTIERPPTAPPIETPPILNQRTSSFGTMFLFPVWHGTIPSMFKKNAELKVSWALTFEGSDVTVGLPTMIQDRLNLLESGNYSDVVFKVADQEFKAHKCILSSQSDYFRAMLESGMREANTNVVVIKDFSADVFKYALHFLYTGWKNEYTSFRQASSVLPLADMYQLSDLAKHCVDKIRLGITVMTVGEVLFLAVRLNQAELKSSAFSFLKTMAEKDRWKILNGFDDELREDFLSCL